MPVFQASRAAAGAVVMKNTTGKPLTVGDLLAALGAIAQVSPDLVTTMNVRMEGCDCAALCYEVVIDIDDDEKPRGRDVFLRRAQSERHQ